jgi:hypothetical protein
VFDFFPLFSSSSLHYVLLDDDDNHIDYDYVTLMLMLTTMILWTTTKCDADAREQRSAGRMR